MTAKDLIELIEEACNGDLDVEVRLAQQPSWPFEYSVGDMALVDMNEPEEDELERDENGYPVRPAYDPNYEPEYVLYIGEGQQLGYLPSAARAELGWR